MNSRLKAERDALAAERAAVEKASSRKPMTVPVPVVDEAAQAKLAEEQSRIKAAVARLEEERKLHAQNLSDLERERKEFLSDVEEWQVQEANLKAYEERLRKQQAQLEAERVQVQKFAHGAGATAGGKPDPKTDEEWKKIQTATQALDKERRGVQSDLLAIKEQEHALRVQEERVKRARMQLEADQKKFQDILSKVATEEEAEDTPKKKGLFGFGKK
jgi:chromosome segregation ATPase